MSNYSNYYYEFVANKTTINIGESEKTIKKKNDKRGGGGEETLLNLNVNVNKCQLCNYTSEKKTNLRRHFKTMHEYSKEELICCGIRFSNKSSYREHNRTVHKNGHTCNICMRTFNRRALVKRHFAVHTGEREFKCNLCNYASSHKSNLDRHKKTHNNNSQFPDSTSQNLESSSKFPILSSLLSNSSSSSSAFSPTINKFINSNSNSTAINTGTVNPEENNRDKKKEISHSIDSILNRKDPPRSRLDFYNNNYKFFATTTATTDVNLDRPGHEREEDSLKGESGNKLPLPYYNNELNNNILLQPIFFYPPVKSEFPFLTFFNNELQLDSGVFNASWCQL